MDLNKTAMSQTALSWRQRALDLDCEIFYASEPNSTLADADYGYAPDEAAFHAALAEHPDWFVMNDARAYTADWPLMLHHCDCIALRTATTRNWPKLVALRREALEQWAAQH